MAQSYALPDQNQAQEIQMNQPFGVMQPNQVVPNQGQGQMDMESLQAYLKTLPPAEQESFLANLLSDPNSKQNMYTKQMAMAGKLRETPSARGRTTRNDIYTAADPLEHFGTAANRALGAVQYGQAENDYEQSEEERQAALRQMADYMLYNGGV